MQSLKIYLDKILAHKHLTFEEAYSCMFSIGTSVFTEAELSSLLTAFHFQPIDLNEIRGFRQALLDLANPIRLESSSEAIDVCGTGGDGKNTFNISTISAFLLASMGYKVIKHGNYGVSSICGSSNVLEELGIQFSTNESLLNKQLDESNLCFLHAPLFHPALKKVANVRKQLGFRTLFNSMGPLVNPAQPRYQLTGTYSLELAKMYSHLLFDQEKIFCVVHGLDGYDELTFQGSTRILTRENDFQLHENPEKTEFELSELNGGNSTKTAAKICHSILSGKGSTAQNSVIAGNVALGLQLFQPTVSFEELYFKAKNHIESGIAVETLKKHIN
ncbi:MAG: anthranilate phosphoribosyltransferase [Fluviicola sp.]